ncbi:MAG TPA: type II secretion system F family protein [bacterium]
MPHYAYRAKDVHLNAVEGVVEAESEAAAISRLGRQGVFPVSISVAASGRAPGAPARRGRARRVSRRTLAHTTRQLADLLAGGVPLFRALTLLSRQAEHAALRGIAASLAHTVREGRSLSESLAAYPSVFSPLYVSMVRAGEVGGGLDGVLARLAELEEHEADLRSRLIGASAYPLFVLVVAMGMTAFLLVYVIPTLAEVFAESGQLLPLPTRMLLALSAAATTWWWALPAAAAGLVWAGRRWGRSPGGRAAFDRLLIRVPGIGRLARQIDVGRFCRNLGIMLGQGVPMLTACDVVTQQVSNAEVRRAALGVREAVRGGAALAQAMEASRQFPPFVANMVAVGEESGTLETALLKVAASYERELDRTLRILTTVLEPALLLVVGGLVMFIVLAMLLPVFQVGLVF